MTAKLAPKNSPALSLKTDIAVVFLSTLLVSSCGNEPASEAKDKTQGRVIEMETNGAEIKIALDDDGLTSLPEWAPVKFELPKNSSIHMTQSDPLGGGFLGIDLTMAPDEATSYFSKALSAEGWSERATQGLSHQKEFTKAEFHLLMSVIPARKNAAHSEASFLFSVQ